MGTPNNVEDAELIKKAKSNTQEYEKLYRKYASNIYVYLWHRVGRSKEIAEDLMQETFLRAFRSLSRFRDQGYSYLTYLIRIAHNLLVNHYRKPKETSLSSSTREFADEGEDLEGTVDRKLEADVLAATIKKLSPKEQELIKMRYKDDLSIKEISEKVDKTENAVKLSLSRTRKRLAGSLLLVMTPMRQLNVSEGREEKEASSKKGHQKNKPNYYSPSW
ncbi:MAG: RNA polymerase sigma factor [Candidatus Wildermuthbacteria bacterium]|nr:RNA polymerase sigma factor [Candidatus Wildermuthbacteria bacterium]